jgi:rhodanese-related sulfurtransferase
MATEAERDVISPEEARELMARPEEQAQVLDLRDSEEFTEGHIVAALNAPDADPDSLPDELAEDVQLIVVCETGARSAEMAAKLRDAGRDAVAIEGGMKAWRSEDLPQQPSADFAEEPKKSPKLPGAGV